MKLILNFILFTLIMANQFNNCLAQKNAISFEKLDSLHKNEERKIVFFIHTDWCRYCQGMINNTFENPSIQKILSESYYFVTLNPEKKEDISFKGKAYKFKPSGIDTGIHELAEEVATINGKISYPTICILNEQNEIIFQFNQFLNSSDLIPILEKLK